MPTMKKVTKVVLTGGPCAGKSSCIVRVKEFLRNRGFEVLTITEAATCLHEMGVHFFPPNPLAYQKCITGTQLAHEDRVSEWARAVAAEGKPVVVVLDRGLLDGLSYCSMEEWKEVAEAVGLPYDLSKVCERYDAVLHLCTAAKGARKHYSLVDKDGKVVRHEGGERACELDDNLLKAWKCHPHRFVFENSKGKTFDDKLHQVMDFFVHLLKVPNTRRRPRKFILRNWPKGFVGVAQVVRQRYTKVYLHLPAWYRRNKGKGGAGSEQVSGEGKQASSATSRTDDENPQAAITIGARKAGKQNEYRFLRQKVEVNKQGEIVGRPAWCLKECVEEEGQMVEKIRNLKLQEVPMFQKEADISMENVVQDRVRFFYQGAYLELIKYLEPKRVAGLCVMNLQGRKAKDGTPVRGTSAETQTGALPYFLEVGSEVTADIQYSAHVIANRSIGRQHSSKG